MAVRVETLVQRYLDRWTYLLGLGGWRITWDIVDVPIIHRGEAVAAFSDVTKKRNGSRVARIRFDRADLKTPARIEELVIHELLHVFDHGLGEDAHKLVYRLERPLRLVRKRLTRR